MLRHIKDWVQLFCGGLWPKLPLGQALLYHKQDAGCIYVNDAVPWNAIRYVHYHGTDQPFYAFTVPNSLVLTSFN